MKRYTRYYMMVGLLATSPAFGGHPNAEDWGPVTDGLQMSIRLADGHSQIETGQTFSLLICYTNSTSSHRFRIYEANGVINDPTYSFTIVAPSGKDVSPDMKKVSAGVSGVIHELDPGQTLTIRYELGKLCKLDQVGTYKIVARKRMGSLTAPKAFVVVSNPLKVTVVAK